MPSDNLFWGAAAAGVIGAATAYALEQRRKRKQEEARQRAEAERANAKARAQEQAQRDYQAALNAAEEARRQAALAAAAAKIERQDPAWVEAQQQAQGQVPSETAPLPAGESGWDDSERPEQGDTLQTLPPGPMCTPTVFDKPKPWWIPSFSAQEAVGLVRTIPSAGVGSNRIPVPVVRFLAPGKMISFGTVTAWNFASDANPGAELRTNGFGAGTINEPDKPSAFARVNLDTGEIASTIRIPTELGFTQDGFSSSLGYSVSVRAKWDGWNTTASVDLNYADVKASGAGVKGNISGGVYLEVKPLQVATAVVVTVIVMRVPATLPALLKVIQEIWNKTPSPLPGLP